MHQEVEAVLKALPPGGIVYIPNSGNAGDSFIAHATYQMLAKTGISFEQGTPEGVYPDATVILGGGGNLVAPYPNLRNFLERNIGVWRRLVILPHTIRAYPEILERLDSDCTIFCREEPSFRFVTENAPNAQVLMSHDMAFAWDPAETRREMKNRPFTDLLNLKLAVRNAKRTLRSTAFRLRAGGDRSRLSAVRADVEATDLAPPPQNIDISRTFAADDMSSVSSLYTTHCMMDFINKFETVTTNRLHIAIMAGMLGKRVAMHDNSYGKNRDVFNRSMAGGFKNVVWSD